MELALQGLGYHEVFRIDGNLYSDNTPYVKRQWGVGFDVDRVVLSVFEPTQFHSAMMLSEYLQKEYPDAQFILYMPYFVGARQDRSNVSGDVLFGAKYYANIINYVGFDKVVVVDPHSYVSPALIDNAVVLSAADIMWWLTEEKCQDIFPERYDGVIAPDAGAAKRAEEISQLLQVPVYQAWKKRDVSTGKISGFGVQEIPEGRYLIVDDICDGGGTFLGLDNALPDGVECDLWVTHGIFSNGTRELTKHFKNIYTTNSLGQYHSNITIFDIREVAYNNDYI